MNCKLVEVSDSFLKLFDIENNEKGCVIGKYLFEFISLESQDRVKANLENIFKLRCPKDTEESFLRPDGTTFYGELLLNVICDIMNKPKYIIAIIRDISKQKVLDGSVIDITERMEIMNKLRESQEMFQLVMDNIPQFIFWKDKESRYLGCNKNFARVAGVDVPEYIVGLQDKDLAWEKEETDFFHETDALVMESEVPEFHIIEQQLQADGKRAWLDTNKIPLHDSEGNVIGLLGTYEDITRRIYSENALKKSEAKYRKAYNNTKFLRDIFSHDINNILQSIQTANELNTIAIDQNEPGESRELTELIKMQVIRGAKLVNAIQKLSELEEYEQNLQPIVIKNILEQAIHNIRDLFQNKSINIQVKSLNNQEAVQANEFLIDIFENLFINSVMFNEHRTIEIGIIFSKETFDKKDFCRIEIRDNGTGIEEIRKLKIFQRVYNKDKTISGLGLGLSLVKKIVDTYNGKIWVEDIVKGDHSKGSNFILLIPINSY